MCLRGSPGGRRRGLGINLTINMRVYYIICKMFKHHKVSFSLCVCVWVNPKTFTFIIVFCILYIYLVFFFFYIHFPHSQKYLRNSTTDLKFCRLASVLCGRLFVSFEAWLYTAFKLTVIVCVYIYIYINMQVLCMFLIGR